MVFLLASAFDEEDSVLIFFRISTNKKENCSSGTKKRRPDWARKRGKKPLLCTKSKFLAFPIFLQVLSFLLDFIHTAKEQGLPLFILEDITESIKVYANHTYQRLTDQRMALKLLHADETDNLQVNGNSFYG